MYNPQTVRPGAALELIETGIDWITLTSRADDHRQPEFRQAAWHACEVQRNVTKEIMTPWHWQGYKGWRVTGLAWGSRTGGDIVIASGATANRYWRLFNRVSTNVSRLDMQVTVTLDRPYVSLTTDYYHELAALGKRKGAHIQNTEGGTTVYIGSRKSDQFGRVYDKGIEAGLTCGPGKVYRYEVEFKAKRAKHTTDKLFTLACHQRPLYRHVLSTVWHWFNDRELRPIFKPSQDSTPVLVQLEARDESAERTLRWLKVQVRPSVERLRNTRELDVLRALGLNYLLLDD